MDESGTIGGRQEFRFRGPHIERSTTRRRAMQSPSLAQAGSGGMVPSCRLRAGLAGPPRLEASDVPAELLAARLLRRAHQPTVAGLQVEDAVELVRPVALARLRLHQH